MAHLFMAFGGGGGGGRVECRVPISTVAGIAVDSLPFPGKRVRTSKSE